MGFGWVLLLVVGVLLITWRQPLLSYAQGRTYLGTELRRYVNKHTHLKQAVLIEDNREHSWSQDLCGVTVQTPTEFLQNESQPEVVVSTANERQMSRSERSALYSQLGQVPLVLRIRHRLTRTTPDMRDIDDRGDRRVVAGNLVFKYENNPKF